MSSSVEGPPRGAPRALWLQLGAQSLYIACGFRLLGLQRGAEEWAGVVAAGALADWTLSRLRGAPRRFPLSGLVAGSSVFLFLESRSPLVYVAAGLAAAASKHLLAWRGRHAFNPGNFGVLFMVLLWPRAAASTGDLWATDTWFILLIAVCGGAVAWLARRWAVALGYAAVFSGAFALAAAAARLFAPDSPYAALPPLLGLGLCLNPFTLIYILHMITDPRTTPGPLRGQLAFGAAVAVADLVLRRAWVLNSPHLALALVCVLRHLWLVRGALASPPAGLERLETPRTD